MGVMRGVRARGSPYNSRLSLTTVGRCGLPRPDGFLPRTAARPVARPNARRMRRPRIRTILAHLARLLAALSIASAAAAQSTGGFALKLDPRLGEERAGVVEGRPVFGRG